MNKIIHGKQYIDYSSECPPAVKKCDGCGVFIFIEDMKQEIQKKENNSKYLFLCHNCRK